MKKKNLGHMKEAAGIQAVKTKSAVQLNIYNIQQA
jgi:hypothetical protein